MPRLRGLSGREVCAILTANGFAEVRRRGSHAVMQRRDGASTLTVPIPLHASLKIGTLLGIVRQSKLPRGLFETQ